MMLFRADLPKMFSFSKTHYNTKMQQGIFVNHFLIPKKWQNPCNILQNKETYVVGNMLFPVGIYIKQVNFIGIVTNFEFPPQI